MTRPLLTPEAFLSGLRCPRRLYLEVHRPELGPPPDPLAASLLDEAAQVRVLARGLAPGGRAVEAPPGDWEEAAAETRRLIQEAAWPAVFEATFTLEEAAARADVLRPGQEGSWDLFLVKPSPRIKQVHLWEVAFGGFVAAEAGLALRRAGVIRLNPDYVRGDDLALEGLFSLVDLTARTAPLGDQVSERITELSGVLAGQTEPEVKPGRQCRFPWPCPFERHCAPERPRDWVGDFYRLRATRKADLLARGLEDIRDLPADEPLSEIQRRIREALVSGEPFLDPKLPEVFQGLARPLHFLDFETISPAVPLYPGTRPFDLVPFQWSLHLETREGRLEHHSFLAPGEEDPRPELVRSLLAAAAPQGAVLTYTHFERYILRDLAAFCPDQAAELEALSRRCVDLRALVRRHLYHPGFGQSFSLKRVLPALAPDLAYDDLYIREGRTASRACLSLVAEPDPAAKARLRQALLDYCRRDTLALVALKRWVLGETLPRPGE